MKRLAAKATPQHLEKRILLPLDLYTWACEDIKDIHPIWVAKTDVAVKRERLSDRYEKALAIPGIRGFHNFEPMSSSSVSVGYTGFSEDIFVLFVCLFVS